MELTIIIINYKTSHLIPELIKTIIENIKVSFLIIDNDSTEQSYKELLSIPDERIKIIPTKLNLGFTGGLNLAINYLIKSNTYPKYFSILNPDALSCPNLFSDLITFLEEDPTNACISPQIIDSHGKLWYSGAMIDFKNGNVINNPKTCFSLKKNYIEVDVFSGCACVFNLNHVVDLGMFNEKLFMYFDEADLSIRLKEKGYKILYSPNHQIKHDVSYSTKNFSHLKIYYLTRNKFIVFNKTMSSFKKLHFIIYQLVFHLKNKRLKHAFFHLKGFLDFKKGRYGQY